MTVVGLASYDIEILFKRLWMVEEDAKEKVGISVKQLRERGAPKGFS